MFHNRLSAAWGKLNSVVGHDPCRSCTVRTWPTTCYQNYFLR